MNIEMLVILNLMKNEAFTRKSLPYLKPDYFENSAERKLFQVMQTYMIKYNGAPSVEALQILLNEQSNFSESEHKKCLEILEELEPKERTTDDEWLLDATEKFCQERAIYNAIMDSIQILDGKVPAASKGAIPKLLSDALGVSFDPYIGHDYMDDFSDRYDFYHRVEERIPFDLDYFNEITKGGIPKKTLNIVLAGTGVGKSLFMCHVAASALLQNLNVLYITLEMAEERIAERIDANLLNTTMDDLAIMPRDMYEKRMNNLHEKVKGKLIVKEYPTASAHSGHFRALLGELVLKRNFKPDVIFIDYLNICASARIKAGSNSDTYSYIKSIAEELRGLAVEFNVPIWSATQVNRTGFSNSDLGLEDTSESFGLPFTADFMIALVQTEELEHLNQMMVKQLKSRYGDPTKKKRFMIGVDKTKMRLYNLESNAQENVMEGVVKRDAAKAWQQETSKKKFTQLKV